MLRARQNGEGKLRAGNGRGNGNGNNGGGGGGAPMNSITLSSLLQFNGPSANGAPFIYDSSLNDYRFTNPSANKVTISTAQAKFGATSGLAGGATAPKTAIYTGNIFPALSMGDFGIQSWVYITTSAANAFIFDGRGGAGQAHPVLYQDSANLYFFSANAIQLTLTKIPLNTWAFVEMSRVSGVVSVYVNGQRLGQKADTTNWNSLVTRWGGDVGLANDDTIYLSDSRVFTAGGNTGPQYAVPTALYTAPYTTTSTWNSAAKGTSVVLMNNDRSAYVPAAFGAVKGTTGKSTGTFQFECTFVGDMEVLVGVGNSSALVNNYPGADVNSWGYYSTNGNKYTNNAGVAYGAAYSATSSIQVVYNGTTGVLTFYSGGVSQGTAFTGLSGTLFPMFGSGNNTAGNRECKINTGQTPFLFPIGGASAWG